MGLLAYLLLLALVMEIITVVGRALFGSMKGKYERIKFRYKVRIHHSYVGLALILIYFIYSWELLLIVGASLLISGIVHHFIVLPIWVGKTEFP